MSPPQFTTALLHPRYWPTWLGFGCMYLVAQLPFGLQMFLGKHLGRLTLHLAKRRRAIAERNIELCFPEKSAAARAQLVADHFQSNGMALFEIGIAWFMPLRRLRKRFTVKGKAHWDALVEQGKGALVIGLHFSTLEIANVEVDRLFTLSTSYRPHKNPVYDFVQYRRRMRHNRHSQNLHRKDIRAMINTLKQGGLLWYAPDQDYGRNYSEFVPWFGIATATVSATPRLLKMAKVPALGIFYRRQADHRGYEIHFLPPLEGLPSGDDSADLAALNKYVEQYVRQNPAEYLWVHRRFKTRPKGEPSLYL
ncbi:MAG: LpxL/LpxP family Kdo(2)-lipid IV(A) lauroyl/palmitoleoyl acyltransferase [Pseudomonadota bacterium]